MMDKKEITRRMEDPQINELAVWWWSEIQTRHGISKVSTLYPVLTVDEAKVKLKELAKEDSADNTITSNIGDLVIFDEYVKDWVTWYNEEGQNIDEIMKEEENDDS